MPEARDPQAVAEGVREAMFRDDFASKMLGIDIAEVGPGRCVATMAVRRDMLNGFGICHGGLIATLADSAFAFACNSYDELTVAAGFSLEIVAPAREGDVLTARAEQAHKSGRLGVYDIEVSNQRGERVGIFRGRSYTMKGKPVIGGGKA